MGLDDGLRLARGAACVRKAVDVAGICLASRLHLSGGDVLVRLSARGSAFSDDEPAEASSIDDRPKLLRYLARRHDCGDAGVLELSNVFGKRLADIEGYPAATGERAGQDRLKILARVRQEDRGAAPRRNNALNPGRERVDPYRNLSEG